MVAFDYQREPLPDSFNREVDGDYYYYLKYARLYLPTDSYKGDCNDLLQDSIFYFWRYVSRKGMPNTREDFRRLLRTRIKQTFIEFLRNSFVKGRLIVNLEDHLDTRHINDSLIDKRDSYANPYEFFDGLDFCEVLKNRIIKILDRGKIPASLIFFSVVDGGKYKEIADEFGISADKVRSKFYYARNKILKNIRSIEPIIGS